MLPIEVNRLIQLRPFLFHLTARENLAGIRAGGFLKPASHWLRMADRGGEIRLKRLGALKMFVDGHRVVVRDQSPLAAGHIAFDEGWDLARLVEALNDRVDGGVFKHVEYAESTSIR